MNSVSDRVRDHVLRVLDGIIETALDATPDLTGIGRHSIIANNARWAKKLLIGAAEPPPLIRYEAWGAPGCAVACALLPPEHPQKEFLTQGLVLLRTFECVSYEEAMQRHHEANGWEPYRPMLEEQTDGSSDQQ